jgi:hypothetical protein
MALDMGPHDGDFARYVETLTNNGGGEPGRVYKAERAARNWSLDRIVDKLPARPSGTGTVVPQATVKPPPSPAERSAQTTAARIHAALARAGESAGQARQSATRATDYAASAGQTLMPNRASSSGPTLASQSRKRTISTILSIVAIWVAVSALNPLIHAINEGDFQVDRLAPSLVRLFFAFVIFRLAMSIRKRASMPPAKLAPIDVASRTRASPSDQP